MREWVRLSVDTAHVIPEPSGRLLQFVARLRELSPLWEMYKDGVDLNTIQWAAH